MVIETDALKRDVLEGERAAAARKHVSRAANRTLRAPKAETVETGHPATGMDPTQIPEEPAL